MADNKNKIVAFPTKEEIEKQIADEEQKERDMMAFQNRALMDMAIKELNKNLDGATGYVAIVFKNNEEFDDSSCIWGGSLDTTSTIGALELAKGSFVNRAVSEAYNETIVPYEDDDDI